MLSNSDEQRKFMIRFSSSIYDILLREVHTKMAEITMANKIGTATTAVEADQDDVCFRFGGATLASMLHSRYSDIRKCSVEKRDCISEEIKVLQSINTKNKAGMPDYLKYRDKGYMYSPDPMFIPFFRAVDECIKSVVNEKGFKEHGDQLVKVSKSCCTHIFIITLLS